MGKILIIHGPNLNLLGIREPAVYGKDRLEDINNQLIEQAAQLNHEVTSFQSNSENDLINRIQQALHEQIDFILINPAAFTHTSVAMRDALLSVRIPFIEIHLSNTNARESFRQKSFFSDIAIGTIQGFGGYSYILGLLAANQYLLNRS